MIRPIGLEFRRGQICLKTKESLEYTGSIGAKEIDEMGAVVE